MTRPQALKKESPQERAWSAMGLLGWSITWNDDHGVVEDADTVRVGMDAMASALVDWKDLHVGAVRLDEVLATLGADDDLVETAARLIDLLGRSTYAGGLAEGQVEEAEGLREVLVEDLDELLRQIGQEGASDD